jgi:lysophospholipase L1-like esterase
MTTTTTLNLLTNATTISTGTATVYPYLTNAQLISELYTISATASGAFTAIVFLETSTDNVIWSIVNTWNISATNAYQNTFGYDSTVNSYMRARVGQIAGTSATVSVTSTISYMTSTSPQYYYDSNNNPIGLSTGSGGVAALGNTHVKVALLGDSITDRNFAGSGAPFIGCSGIGMWNWANWILGAPFILQYNLAVSGDQTLGIFSRASSIPPDTQLVFAMGGTNDILNSAATATIISRIQAGVANLIAAGKTVVLSTVPPQDSTAVAPFTGASLTSLLAVNAAITALATTYPGIVFVADFYAATVSATPGVATAGYMNTTTNSMHPTHAGAQAFGLHSTTQAALKAAFARCMPDINPYENYQVCMPLYSEMRVSTGGTVGSVSVGITGTPGVTVSDGWNGNRAAGTPTATLTLSAYTPPTTFIGPAARQIASTDSNWQTITCNTSAAADSVQLQFIPAIGQASTFRDAIYPGCTMFMEVEVNITSPTLLQEVRATVKTFFTSEIGRAHV